MTGQIRLISRESFDAFAERYITLTEIGYRKNLHWRIVRRHLASAGCVPAYVWDTRGNAIYERTAALETVMARIPTEPV